MEVKNNQEQIEEVEPLQRQDEVISALQEKSNKKSNIWAKKTQRIEEAYLRYSDTSAESDLKVLLDLLDDYCINQVRKLLYKTSCYTKQEEEDILQEAQWGVDSFIKDVKAGKKKVEKTFAACARGIYGNKTLQAIDKLKDKQTEPLTDEDGNIIDIPAKDSTYEDDRRRYASVEVYRIYCSVIMNSELYADGLLAICYAKVLPHMLDAILESKVTSPKWAYNRMKGKSFDELRQESEEIIYDELQDKALVWGRSFLDKLSEFIEVDGDRIKRGDAIYTELYDQKQIGHMSEYMDGKDKKKVRKMFKAAQDIIKDRDDIKSVFEDYYTKDTVIGELIRGGETR